MNHFAELPDEIAGVCARHFHAQFQTLNNIFTFQHEHMKLNVPLNLDNLFEVKTYKEDTKSFTFKVILKANSDVIVVEGSVRFTNKLNFKVITHNYMTGTYNEFGYELEENVDDE